MRLILALATLMGLAACVVTPARGPQVSMRVAPPEAVSGVGALQGYRRAAGLPALRRSPRLDAAARGHAHDMARNAFFSHTGSNGSTHTRRIRAHGCSGGAENIAAGPYTAHSVMAAWMGSPGHRRNMLLPTVTHYGLAHVGDKWVLKLSRNCP